MENKKVENIIKVEPINKVASPGPAIAFTFSVYSVLCWAVMAGVFKEGAGLSLGIVQLCGAVGFTILSTVNIIKGNPFGSVNAIFAFAFGLYGGVNGICTVVFPLLGLQTSVQVTGVVNLMAGLYLTGVLVTLLDGPAYIFIYMLTASVGLDLLGIAQIFNLGNLWYVIVGYCFLVTGILGLYHAVSETCESCGVDLPQGPALKPRQNK